MKTVRAPEKSMVYLRGGEEGSLHLRRRPFDFLTDVPPPDLMQYGESPTQHLETGRATAGILRKSLTEAGYSYQPGDRFLDFGCANARVLRFLRDWAETGEGWGADMNARTIVWCLEHMSPPFHFCVSSTQPNLPFESRYFMVVFANSVLTHIDDLFFSWLQELRRVTAIGGYLFVTILDEGSAALIPERPDSWLNSRFSGDPALAAFSDQKGDMLGIRRGPGSMVFVRRQYFESLVRPWFEIGARTELAMGKFQPGYVLIRRQ